jgi:GR25 family glycosyltransferase involved in LPS biosynthesis
MNKYKCIIVIIIFLIIILYLNNTKEAFSNDKHPINQYFDSVNVITVPDRKQYMKDAMKYFGITANFIDATLVKNIDYNELLNNNFVAPDYYSEKNKGRIACHLSQIKLIKEFIKSNDKNIFIFEDDIARYKHKNYKSIIDDSMNNIPDDWDIVFFGRCHDNCNKKIEIKNNLYKVHSPKCRHAYGLSRKGAKKILQYTVPMVNNGDVMYSSNIKSGNIIAYAIHPSIFSQNRDELGSNIGNGYKNNVIKRIQFYAYKIRNKFVQTKYNEFPATCKIGT